MSSLDNTTESIIAAAIGFNDGANKGFWRVQLRDRLGQWMEMGRGLMAKVRMPKGDIKDLRGVYIGPSDRAGYGRMLVENEDGSFTTYEVTSGNAQQFEATISEADLERQGIKNDNAGDIGDRLDEDIQTEEDMNPQPSTEEDIKLATVVPDDKQKEIIKKSREESPLAKLPAGAERTMSKEELAKAVGISEAKDETSPAAATDSPFEDALVQLWNEGAYGDKADIDAALAKLPKEKRERKDFGLNITGASRAYALDLQEGDYIYDPLSTDVFKITGEPFVNEDGNAITVPAVNQDGKDVSFDYSNEGRLDKIAYSDKPKEEAPKEEPPVDQEPAPETPELTDAAVEKPASEIAVGDKLWSTKGSYLGEVELAKPSKDAMTGKTTMRIRYRDEYGREYLTSYPMDTMFRAESPAKEEQTPATPEAPAVPEAPATPEADVPATPEAPKAKAAKVSPEDMTMSQLLEDVKTRLTKADASKGANPDYYKAAYAILDDATLTDAQKLGKIAETLRTTSLSNGGGSQKETTRQVMQNLRVAGVYEASKEYEKELADKAAAKTKVAEKPKIEEASRVDDGQPIAPAELSREEMKNLEVQEVVDSEGNPLPDLNGEPIYHANAILNAIMKANPNAKLTKDGALVIERSSFTDHDGTEYDYEITLHPTFGGQILEQYTIKDKEGNVVEDFYHKDFKDSIRGIYGDKNGVVVFRDQLLGRATPPGKLTRAKLSYFGTNKTLANRMTFFRGAGSKDPHAKAIKIQDVDQQMRDYLQGRGRLISEVDKNAPSANIRGSQSRSYVASFFEAFEKKDTGLMREILVQALGRMPDNEESRNKLIAIMADELKKRYMGTGRGHEIGLAVENLRRWMSTEGVDLRNLAKIPFVSTDGTTPVQIGDKVRAYGNENQTMIGIVTRLNKRSGKGGSYKDTIAIKFADGKVVNVFAARNVEILGDDHPDADEPLDNYEPWIRGDEMRKIRLGDDPALPREYVSFGDGDTPDADSANPDAGTPYLGSDGSSGSDDSGTAAEDKQLGDAWYSEDGEYLGSISDIVEVPAEDGGEPGIAIVYVDADGIEQVEVVDKGTIRLPK